MPDLDIESLLKTGYYQTSRAKSPNPSVTT